MLKKFANLYETTKTVRFGLSPKDNLKAEAELAELVEKSLANFEKETIEKEKKELINVTESVEKIRQYLEGLKIQAALWQEIHQRTDLTAVSKEYYKKLEKDARFEGFWRDDRGKKQPQASEISLAFLKNQYAGKPRSEYVTAHWTQLLQKTFQLIDFFEPLLVKYEKALAQSDQAHLKPNLVDFRKQFLSLLGVSNRWLLPLVNQAIVFPKIANASDNEENQKVRIFLTEENQRQRMDLQKLGNSLRDFFQANGSKVPFGKATLNYYTAKQKPNDYNTEIEALFEKVGIERLLEKVKKLNKEELKNYFRYQTYAVGNRLNSFMAEGALTTIEKIQLFKPKSIPAGVRFSLAEKLAEKTKIPVEKIMEIFEEIGSPLDVANEYKQLTDKNLFDLNRYPIKLAFDYAWESLASFLKGRISEADFPKEQCVLLLKKFGADGGELKLYANLRYIRDELATIEHGKPSAEKETEIIINIQKTFAEIVALPGGESNREVLLNWISKPRAERNPKDKRFIEAKQQIGLKRGKLKNKIAKYGEMTMKFGDLAMDFGGNIANLRDKLREENEHAKINFYGVILEDLKKNRHLLLLPLEAGNSSATEIENRLDILEGKLSDDKPNESCFGAYKVASFTSKALVKMLKNSKGGSAGFHIESEKVKISATKMQKEWQTYQNEKGLLDYAKKCLTESAMAKVQNWEKFGWNFQNCDTYADLEKEVDLKGYAMEKKYILKQDIEKLINDHQCWLFPVVNQDYASQKCEDRFVGCCNAFTLEMEKGMCGQDGYRVHPEFALFYQKPTDDYPGSHRFGRWQLSANFGLEVKKATADFKTKKEKLKLVRDKNNFQKEVQVFNEKINRELQTAEEVYFYGMDRGINELATLCLLSSQKTIQDFIVFKKEKKSRKAVNKAEAEGNFYTYAKWEKQSILDLTNLKVETWNLQDENHPNSKFLKEAFEELRENEETKELAEKLGYVFDEKGRCKILVEYPNDRSNVLKLRMNHFQRALQFATSNSEKREIVSEIATENFAGKDLENFGKADKARLIQALFGLKADFSNDDNKVSVIDQLSTNKFKLQKVATENQTLFLEMFEPLIQQLWDWYQHKDEADYEKTAKAKYEELENLDSLKKGMVANMVGVFSFLIQKFPGMIVLENVAKEKEAQTFKTSRLDQREREVTSHQEAEHHRWAGTELYRYLEKKLVSKFSNWQQATGEILNLTPSFANLDSLNKQAMVVNGEKSEGVFQFGIFCYIPAEFTTLTCPCCNCKGKLNVERDHRSTSDNIICKQCGFNTRCNNQAKACYGKNKEIEELKKSQFMEALLKIKSSDQNAAFIIAKQALNILIK